MRPSQIVDLMRQIASGMEYLSGRSIVHRDLAARNILLVSKDAAKVSDFGMARRVDPATGVYIGSDKKDTKWPLKWYPPSVWRHGRFDEKTDVWSFGVAFWEAASGGERPYGDSHIDMILMRLENGYRLERPDECPEDVYNIMFKCWLAEKRDRPTFADLAAQLKQKLEAELNKLNGDLNSFLYSFDRLTFRSGLG